MLVCIRESQIGADNVLQITRSPKIEEEKKVKFDPQRGAQESKMGRLRAAKAMTGLLVMTTGAKGSTLTCPPTTTQLDTFNAEGKQWVACEDLSIPGGAIALVTSSVSTDKGTFPGVLRHPSAPDPSLLSYYGPIYPDLTQTHVATQQHRVFEMGCRKVSSQCAFCLRAWCAVALNCVRMAAVCPHRRKQPCLRRIAV